MKARLDLDTLKELIGRAIAEVNPEIGDSPARAMETLLEALAMVDQARRARDQLTPAVEQRLARAALAYARGTTWLDIEAEHGERFARDCRGRYAKQFKRAVTRAMLHLDWAGQPRRLFEHERLEPGPMPQVPDDTTALFVPLVPVRKTPIPRKPHTK